MPEPTPVGATRRRRWRRFYFAALLMPLLPSLGLFAISWLADAGGCKADFETACMIGPLSLGHAFAVMATVARLVGQAMIVGAPLLAALCCLAVHRWRKRLGGRLALAFLAAVILAYLPFLGPIAAIDGLMWTGCRVNEGGPGPCRMFGVDIGPQIHELGALPWMIMFGGVSLLIWGVYAVGAIVLRLRERWKAAAA